MTQVFKKPANKSLLLLVFCGFVFAHPLIHAQTNSIRLPLTGKQAQTETEDVAENPAAIRFSDSESTSWEFGLTITSTGLASGVSASVPIPMEWPEQNIGSEQTEKTENVGSIRTSNPTKESRQMVFSVNRLNPGETATVIARFQINKTMIVAPSDPSQLKFVSPVPTKLKTFLKSSPQIECKHQRIREIAGQLRDESLTAWDQIETIYRWVRDNIEYKFDSEIHTCLEALDSKQGDCEELSSLFIAICRAMDIPARAVWIPGHTYPEFYLEDKSGTGYWFPCQAAGEYQFGSMSDLRPVLQKGDRFRLPGKSGYVRYLQPSLMAKNASGELSIEWISREVAKNSSKIE
jgi:hypothetical protein